MNLLNHAFFNIFPPEMARSLAAVAQRKVLAVDAVIFREGDESDSVILVLTGRIEVIKDTYQAAPLLISVVEAGDYFGEMGVFDGGTRSKSAIARTPSEVATIPRDPFLRAVREAPGRTAMTFMEQVITQLRSTTDRFVTDVVKKEKLALVGEMANTIIHDIRGPFTSVQLGTDLISEKYDDPETREICEMMRGQIGRVKSMAEELLEFARGTSSIRLELTDLSDIISQFHFLNRDFVASTNVRLDLSHARVKIFADTQKVLRVLQNLLNNAVEALKGRPDAHVTITAGQEGEWAEIKVSDNGPGIPEAIRDRMFEPFVTHGKSTGTGLGMAITKSIVQAHHGTITFTTASGHGTTFTLRLPVAN